MKRLIIALSVVCLWVGGTTAQDLDEKLTKTIANTVAKVEKAKTAQEVWQYASTLEKYRDTTLEYFSQNSPTTHRLKLIHAKLLLQDNQRRAGLLLLRDIIAKRSSSGVDKLMAARVLESEAQNERDLGNLGKLLDRPHIPPLVKIQIAKMVRKIGHDTYGSRFLKRYLRASDPNIKAEAAMALAEIGNNMARVRRVLKKVASEPTTRGIRARLLLEQMKLIDSLSRTQGLSSKQQVQALNQKVRELKRKNKALEMKIELGMNTGQALLDEVLSKVEKFYDYSKASEIDKKKLLDAAAKGITDHLDQHSTYFTMTETKRFKESMSSQYPGIGAYIQKASNGYLKISQPVYSGPAYKAGLRSNDIITAIKLGKKGWVRTNSKKITNILSRLRGPKGSKVDLRVYRKGWKKEKEFSITREIIQIPFVYTAVLPNKIGYILLTSFGETSSKEFTAGLEKLKKAGVKGLILDLRNNPGGLLTAAVQVADHFLPPDQLIVYSKGRNSTKAPRREFKSTSKAQPPYPMVVLVNGNSASASEIVSGALKVHKRAALVGTKTYGKGSVQEIMPLRSKSYKALLKLTIAKYYLPDGTNIDKKGIIPDIKVKSVRPSDGDMKIMARLQSREAFDQYVSKYYLQYKKTFHQLSRYDYYDHNRYPEFDTFYKSLKTKATKDLVRRVLRIKIRRKVADEKGHQLMGDYQDDRQLQVGILELLRRMNVEAKSVPEFKKLKR